MKVLAKQPDYTENFYLQDETLQNILKDKLPSPFFNYADRELAILGLFVRDPLMNVRSIRTVKVNRV